MSRDPQYVIALLERAVAERNNPKTGKGGQRIVGEELGCSGSLICQLLAGEYLQTDKWYPLIVERYGNETVDCPSLGKIPLNRCAKERDLPPGAPSAAYAKQRRICKTCERRKQ